MSTSTCVLVSLKWKGLKGILTSNSCIIFIVNCLETLPLLSGMVRLTIDINNVLHSSSTVPVYLDDLSMPCDVSVCSMLVVLWRGHFCIVAEVTTITGPGLVTSEYQRTGMSLSEMWRITECNTKYKWVSCNCTCTSTLWWQLCSMMICQSMFSGLLAGACVCYTCSATMRLGLLMSHVSVTSIIHTVVPAVFSGAGICTSTLW